MINQDAKHTFLKRMNALRVEADEAHDQVEELKAKVKALEQENLSKEQEITSLNHRNQLLEEEVEKLESSVKDAKDAANQSAQHDTQNEALQRRVQLLEEEAEENDKTLRETNEKYDWLQPRYIFITNLLVITGSVKPMSRLATTSARCRHWRQSAISGRPSTRRWPRSTATCRRICKNSSSPSATFKSGHVGYRCRMPGDVGLDAGSLPRSNRLLFHTMTGRVPFVLYHPRDRVSIAYPSMLTLVPCSANQLPFFLAFVLVISISS
jgi:tropomyosin